MASRIDVTLEGLHQLLKRIDRRQLEAGDWAVIAALVLMLIARTVARQVRLKAKAAQQAAGQNESEPQAGNADGAREEECPSQGGDGESGEGELGSESGETAPPGAPKGADSAVRPAAKKGHGRNGVDTFTNATKSVHDLTAGIIGALCTRCERGRVFPYRDKVIIVVVGQPLFEAERHHFEQGRCRRCGAIFTAEGLDQRVQAGVGSSYVVYDWSACAMLSVMHYFAGGPFKRLEALHRGWGVPLSDANQWRIVDECDDLLAPLYKALERHAIQHAKTLRFDDTGSMIIETRRQIQKELEALTLLGESTRNVRTGINASGVYIETAEGKVVLFFTGRHHAAEIVDQLLEHRRARHDKLVSVSDAASKNFSLEHADELEQAVCNAHCYLKFRAVKAQFPAEYQVAAEVYAKVFDNDDEAEARALGPHERMLYHRQHSKPQMLRLWQMCKDQTDENLVEPNSPLWAPVSFVINQWSRLTKFYEVPGVPLDTNLVEQTLIIPVRYLAGSFAYKTQNGAEVGDHHMSLIATANANGIEPVAYLTECLRNHEQLAKTPELFLPWRFRERGEPPDEVASPRSPPAAAIEHPLRPGTHRAQRRNRAPFAGTPQPSVGLGPDG
jgi:transposase